MNIIARPGANGNPGPGDFPEGAGRAEARGRPGNVFDLMRRIRGAAGLDPAAKLVMLEILDRAGNGRGVCTASSRTIAAGAGVSERQVRRSVGELEACGWIVVEREGGSPKSPRRRIRVAAPLALAPPVAPEPTAPREPGPDEEMDVELPPAELDSGPTRTPCPSYTDIMSELLGQDVLQTASITATGTPCLPSPEREKIRTTEAPRAREKADVLLAASMTTSIHPELPRLLAGCRDLESRVSGDWGSLALAIVATELGRAAGRVDDVRHPLAYLSRAAERFRTGVEEPGPVVAETLGLMLQAGPFDPREPSGRGDLLIPGRVAEWVDLRMTGLHDQVDSASLDAVEDLVRIEAETWSRRFKLKPREVERRTAWIDRALAEWRRRTAIQFEGFDGFEGEEP